MAKFSYVALDSRGKETKGTLDVANQNEAPKKTNGLTHSASMRANAIGIHPRYAPCVSGVYASNFPPFPLARS